MLIEPINWLLVKYQTAKEIGLLMVNGINRNKYNLLKLFNKI